VTHEICGALALAETNLENLAKNFLCCLDNDVNGIEVHIQRI
jgi:hypothetical protein